MTRKHFQALADSIRTILDLDARTHAAIAVANACKRMNPNFKHDRFYAACGLTK